MKKSCFRTTPLQNRRRDEREGNMGRLRYYIGRVMVVMRNSPKGNKLDLKTNELEEIKEKEE